MTGCSKSLIEFALYKTLYRHKRIRKEPGKAPKTLRITETVYTLNFPTSSARF